MSGSVYRWMTARPGERTASFPVRICHAVAARLSRFSQRLPPWELQQNWLQLEDTLLVFSWLERYLEPWSHLNPIICPQQSAPTALLRLCRKCNNSADAVKTAPHPRHHQGKLGNLHTAQAGSSTTTSSPQTVSDSSCSPRSIDTLVNHDFG